jgi:hypothetical protein
MRTAFARTLSTRAAHLIVSHQQPTFSFRFLCSISSPDPTDSAAKDAVRMLKLYFDDE